MILICPRCDDKNIISPLVTDRGNTTFSMCPQSECDYKLTTSQLITEIKDQTITTT